MGIKRLVRLNEICTNKKSPEKSQMKLTLDIQTT